MKKTACLLFSLASSALVANETLILNEQFQLTAAPGQRTSDGLGEAVVSNGQRIAVGGAKQGEVRIYDAITGSFIDLIKPTEAELPAGSSSFGASLAIHENTLIIGVPEDSQGDDSPRPNGIGAGALFVYNIDTLVKVREIKAPTVGIDENQGNQLGRSVDTDGTYIVATAPGELTGVPGGNVNGVVFVFRLSDGTFVHKTAYDDTDEDPRAMGGFDSVAVSGGHYVIGQPEYSTSSGRATPTIGRVLVFRVVDGSFVAGWENPDPNDTEGFGAAFDIDGSKILIGHPGENDDVGKVFLYDIDQGFLGDFTLPGTGTDSDDALGSSIHLVGGRGFVSAPGFDGDVEDEGRVLELDINGLTCTQVFRTKTGVRRTYLGGENVDGDAQMGGKITFANGQLVVGAPQTQIETNSSAGSAFVFPTSLSAAPLTISSITIQGTDSLITWDSGSAGTFTVQWSADLSDWQDVDGHTALPLGAGLSTRTLTAFGPAFGPASAQPNLYYRVTRR